MRIGLTFLLAATFVAVLFPEASLTAGEADLPQVINTQDPQDIPPTPLEALSKITLPEGFSATLFAGDPDVRQPLAFCHDDRGRLWVVENYSYPEWKVKNSDRILIFEDTDNDGRYDSRKVFYDRGNQLTGIEIGMGGVWLTAAPYLIFIPDADRDDRPDAEPQIILDGFNLREVGHNVVSGLHWGPDGWLYGRHGIKATSNVGRPGALPSERVMLNCSIWRYHPTRHTFEVVTRGTTNPWGFDYNDVGEMFFTNNVNGHLWHAIPGASFQRMHGIPFKKHLYETMTMCADHFHWAGTDWSDTRKRKGEPNKHDQYGGGHSHCGGMIYLGDNWPDEYRGQVFTCNTHGKRINQTNLQRRGAGYVGVRAPDFMRANSDWFRGVELKYGPDGGVLVTDWTDLGECHDRDGIHRSSGRIYKIIYGKPKSLPAFDLNDRDSMDLVQLQLHRNDWYVRHARRILWERFLRGKDMRGVHGALLEMFENHPDVTRKLRAMWALNVTGGIDRRWLLRQLDHDNQHVRVWAIRLLVDLPCETGDAVGKFTQMAKQDPSPLVRLYLASALQRIPLDDRWEIAAALMSHAQDADDKDLPLMIWYGVEPAIPTDFDRALRMIQQTNMPRLRPFIARRMTAEIDRTPSGLDRLVAMIGSSESAELQFDLMSGVKEALRGRRKVDAPQGWSNVQAKLSKSSNPQLRELALNIGVVFGDGLALDDLRKTMLSKTESVNARRRAIVALVEVRAAGLAPQLQILVSDRQVRTAAIEGLATYDDPKTGAIILKGYARFDKPEKKVSVDTLVSRATYAGELLAAVEQELIPPTDITAIQARQIHSLGDASLSSRLDEVWGTFRATPAEKRNAILRYKKLLTTKASTVIVTDLGNGRAIFKKQCSQCHKLFDDGGNIGPNLTGSGRANLDYILQNVLDPSAVVAADYRVSVVVLNDGRVLTGNVHPASESVVSIQTEKEKLLVQRDEIEEIRRTSVSLMPDGLLKDLDNQQVRDLVGYLAFPAQVPLPESFSDAP